MSNLAFFPQTPMNNEEREERAASSTQYSVKELSSSTTRVRAREDDETTRRVWEADLTQYFHDTFGAPCSPLARRDMAAAMEAGLDPQLIVIAMDEAALAPRPSWAYARAILRRLIDEGVQTEQDYEARQRRWRCRRKKNDDLPF